MIDIFSVKLGQTIEVNFSGEKIRGIIVGIDSTSKSYRTDIHSGKITWEVLEEYKDVTFPDVLFDTFNEWIHDTPNKYKIIE